MKRVLAVRQDNNGDVLLAGPAVRALRVGSDRVDLLCGPRGAAAAALLPGVDECIVWEAAWIDADPRPVNARDVHAFVGALRTRAYDEAVIFTSFHQSPLPIALLLRMAGIGRIGAICEDYPGSLLDVRHHVRDDVHEVERALSLVAAMGYESEPPEGRALRVRGLPEHAELAVRDAIVIHPGCSVPARAWTMEGNRAVTAQLAREGWTIVVTGDAGEASLTASVCADAPGAIDAGGRTTFAEFAAIARDAAVVVSGNTAAAHVAAAVGTPVVSIFPPTIPAARFRPWMVPHVLLGDQSIACAGCRARVCPIAGQPCLREVTPERVVDAVHRLAAVTDAA